MEGGGFWCLAPAGRLRSLQLSRDPPSERVDGLPAQMPGTAPRSLPRWP